MRVFNTAQVWTPWLCDRLVTLPALGQAVLGMLTR